MSQTNGDSAAFSNISAMMGLGSGDNVARSPESGQGTSHDAAIEQTNQATGATEVSFQQQDSDAIVETDLAALARAEQPEPEQPARTVMGADYSKQDAPEDEGINSAFYDAARDAGLTDQQLKVIKGLPADQQRELLGSYLERERQQIAGIDPSIMQRAGLNPAAYGIQQPLGGYQPSAQPFSQQPTQGYQGGYQPQQPQTQPQGQGQPFTPLSQDQLAMLGEYDSATASAVQNMQTQFQQMQSQMQEMRRQHTQFVEQQMNQQILGFYDGFKQDKAFRDFYHGPAALQNRQHVEHLAAAIHANTLITTGKNLPTAHVMGMAHRMVNHDRILGKAHQDAVEQIQKQVQSRHGQVSLSGRPERAARGQTGEQAALANIASFFAG